MQKNPLPVENLSNTANAVCSDEDLLTCSNVTTDLPATAPLTKQQKIQQVKDYMAQMPKFEKMKEQRREKLIAKIDKLGTFIDKLLPNGKKPANNDNPYPGNDDADVAFALGISAIVIVWFLFPIGLALGAAALGIAVRARRKGLSRDGEQRATTGLVTGAVALAIALIPTIVLIAVFSVLAASS